MKYVYCENCREAFPAPAVGTQKCPRCGMEGYPVLVKRGINGLFAHIMAAGIVLLIIVHYVEGSGIDIVLAPVGIVLAALFVYFSLLDNRHMKEKAVEMAIEAYGLTGDTD